MTDVRNFHTASVLPNGKLLVAGGENGVFILKSAELYDPSTGIWTNTGSINNARMFHTASVLQNGKILVNGDCNSSELYNSSAETRVIESRMNVARYFHQASRLIDGNVLAIGGYDDDDDVILKSAELYVSSTKTSTAIDEMDHARSTRRASVLKHSEMVH